MKGKWKVSMVSAFLMVNILSACNVDNNEPNKQDDEEVDDFPVHDEDDIDTNAPNQDPKPFNHDENPDQTDQRLQKGDDLQFDSDRGAE